MIPKKEKTLDYRILVEVQSASVIGSLVAFSDRSVYVIAEYTKPLSHSTRPPHVDGLEKLEKAVKEVISESTKEFIKNIVSVGEDAKISSVHFILSSPWILSQASIASKTFEKNTLINTKLIDSIIASKQIQISSQKIKELQVIDKSILNISLNGYSVRLWEGKKAEKIDISIIVSASSGKIVSALDRATKDVLPHAKIYKHSSLIMQFISSMSKVPHDASHTVVNIHGQVTDIMSVGRHGEIFFGSFPMGTSTLVNMASKALKVGGKAAESIVKLHTDMYIDPTFGKKSRQSIDSIMSRWSDHYREFARSGLISGSRPSDVVICTDSFAPLYIKSMRSTNLHSSIHISDVNSYADAIHSLAYGAQ